MATTDQPESTMRRDVHRQETSPFIRVLTDQVARVLFALPFLMFGIMHFMMPTQMVGTVPDYLPAPYFWVYVTGAAHLAASTAIALNWMIREAGGLLAVMLLGFVFMVHLPGVLAGGDQMALSLTNLLKDTALAGGALMAAHYASHYRGDRQERTPHFEDRTTRAEPATSDEERAIRRESTTREDRS